MKPAAKPPNIDRDLHNRINRLLILVKERQLALAVPDTDRAAQATELIEDQLNSMTLVQMRAALVDLCAELEVLATIGPQGRKYGSESRMA